MVQSQGFGLGKCKKIICWKIKNFKIGRFQHSNQAGHYCKIGLFVCYWLWFGF